MQPAREDHTPLKLLALVLLLLPTMAKTAYYLQSKGNLKVMIAGCDNFRAGAIEQLQTHARCLDIPLYE